MSDIAKNIEKIIERLTELGAQESRSSGIGGETTTTPSESQTPENNSSPRLSTELEIKFITQRSRIVILRDLMNIIPEDHSSTSLEDVEGWTSQIEELHEAFLKTHAYFEVTWPEGLLDHEYFTEEMHQQEAIFVMHLRLALNRLRHALTGSLRVSTAEFPKDTRFQSKIPDISLPTFSGDRAAWPSFRNSFTQLVLDNQRLSTIERLYYLRACMVGSPAKLICNLPLVGPSLKLSWILLEICYEKKRLLIQNQLDKLMNISAPISCNAEGLTKLISTSSQAITLLRSLCVNYEIMGECILVHHVTRQLDHTTQELWEESLGESQEYPRFSQLETFLASRARDLEDIDNIIPSQPRHSTNCKPPAQGTPSAHQESTEPAQPQPQTDATPSASDYECDCCSGTHFIVMCPLFRELRESERRRIALQKALCFNCLGRHSVSACKSTRNCKTCSERHHTMLHSSKLHGKTQPTNSSSSCTASSSIDP